MYILSGRGYDSDFENSLRIQVVDGYSFLSENLTLAETRETAFINVKRQALEMKKSFIQSKTTVQNFELVDDRINATSEGSVKIIEQKDIQNNGTKKSLAIKTRGIAVNQIEKGTSSLAQFFEGTSTITIKK